MTTYTITELGGCRIVTGKIPLSAMIMLIHGFPKDAILDYDLARMLDAALAIGMPEDTQRLKNDPSIREQARQRVASRFGAGDLPQSAIEWLATGQRGGSSECMFHRFTRRLDPKPGNPYPLDPSDLRRCRLLLDQVPEFQPLLPLMSDVSSAWAGVIENWTTLCNTMDAESPLWRDKKGSAPETALLLKYAVLPQPEGGTINPEP